MKLTSMMIAGIALASTLAACALPNFATAVQARESTPREAALMMQQKIEPAVKELADACEAGLMDAGTLDLIDRYAPAIRASIGAYASSARPCLVVDGTLRTDPEAMGICYRGSVQKASSAVPSVLKEVGLAVGGEMGKRAFLAGVAASAFIGRGDALSEDGFDTGVTDYSLRVFDDTWASVQADADRLQACAAGA